MVACGYCLVAPGRHRLSCYDLPRRCSLGGAGSDSPSLDTIPHRMPGFLAGIADNSKSGARKLSVREISIAGEIFPRLLIGVLGVMAPSLILASLNSPLLIVEFICLFHHPLHVDSSIIHIFIQSVMSHRYSLLET